MKTIFLAALAATAAVPAADAATFAFSETFGIGSAGPSVPLVATGTFEGDLYGALIDNLRNINVFLNGVAFNGNGTLRAAGFDDAAGQWVDGKAVVSLDGTANFMFLDGDVADPNANATNYYYSMSATKQAVVVTGIGLDGSTSASGYSTALSPGVALKVVRIADAAVPEPATWALMVIGFAVVGYGLRRRDAERTAAI